MHKSVASPNFQNCYRLHHLVDWAPKRSTFHFFSALFCIFEELNGIAQISLRDQSWRCSFPAKKVLTNHRIVRVSLWVILNFIEHFFHSTPSTHRIFFFVKDDKFYCEGNSVHFDLNSCCCEGFPHLPWSYLSTELKWIHFAHFAMLK